MRTETKSYFLKEYGSWSVLIVSFITGLAVSRGFSWLAVPLFAALAFLINSKQAYTLWTRKGDRTGAAVFLGQLLAAAGILVALFRADLTSLLWLLIFPAAYLILNRLAGEHFVLTEVLGFILISLAAVLAKFLITGGIDIRLFVAAAVYFSAGVFKVKALLRKRMRGRTITALYAVFAAFWYRGFHIPLIILLPLLDNLFVAARPYSVKLRTTGWIEVAKSLLFLALMIAFYS